MRSLLSLKEWLTLEEAADHLSTVFRETVSVADLYRFALGGHLTLSVHFVNHARARLGRKVRIRDAGFRILPALEVREGKERCVRVGISAEAWPEYEAWIASDSKHAAILVADEPRQKMVLLNGNQVSATECIQHDLEVSTIDGVWDLPMIGAERLDIEHALQQEVGGPSVELIHLDGAYVANSEGDFGWLQEHMLQNEYASEAQKKKSWSDPKAYYPAGGLPHDAPVIVRVANLLRFLGEVQGAGMPEDSKPAKLRSDREENLLRVIAGLWALSGLPAEHNTTADKVSALFDSWQWDKPAKSSIADTILKQAASLPGARIRTSD